MFHFTFTVLYHRLKNVRRFFVVVFIILTFIFLLRYILVGQATYGDGRYYWSYTRSLYFDYDLDLRNELAHQFNPKVNNSEDSEMIRDRKISINKVDAYRQPLGTSLFWLPFFAIADLLGRFLSVFGPIIILNGFSDLYQITVGLGNVLFIIIGLYFCYKLLNIYYSNKVVLLSIVTIYFYLNFFRTVFKEKYSIYRNSIRFGIRS